MRTKRKEILLYEIAQKWGFSSAEEFISSFGINIDDIGQLVSNRGYEHIVFSYQDKKVIKIPKPRLTMKISRELDMEKDIQILQYYFPGKMIEDTTVLHNKKQHDIECIIQRFVPSFAYLQKEHLKDLEIKKQYDTILSQTQLLYRKHNLALDLIGYEGFMSYLVAKIKNWIRIGHCDTHRICLSNVIVDNKELKLVDYRLMPTSWREIHSIRSLIMVIYGNFEHIWLKVFLKILF